MAIRKNFVRFPILEHLRTIETELAHVNDAGISAVAAACCQRQVVEFSRAVQDLDAAHAETLAQILSEVWLELIDGNPLSSEIIGLLQAMFAVNLEADETGVAVNIIGSLENLVIGSDRMLRTRAVNIAELALNQIDAMLDEVLDLPVTEENRNTVCRHQIFLLEVNRQLDDVNTLRDETTVQRIRLLTLRLAPAMVLPRYGSCQ